LKPLYSHFYENYTPAELQEFLLKLPLEELIEEADAHYLELVQEGVKEEINISGDLIKESSKKFDASFILLYYTYVNSLKEDDAQFLKLCFSEVFGTAPY
jgi:Tat protein secretion system quality control protein TatD with DNase activity